MPLRELLDQLLTSLETGPLITAVRHIEARPAVFAPFPSSMDPRLVEALRARGISQLYSHQAKAFEIVSKGEHLVTVTPTASHSTPIASHAARISAAGRPISSGFASHPE